MPIQSQQAFAGRRSLLRASVLVLLPFFSNVERDATATEADPLDRVQLHRNANRGVPYLELARAEAEAGPARLVVRPVLVIELDGEPLQNVHASLRPIDVDGDGRFEFAHWNGTRFLQVWDDGGRKLWRVANPGGYLHELRKGTDRDTAAVLDLDGDGGQDIAHCWGSAGRRQLVHRRGRDGAVIRSVPLGSGDGDCHMAAFRVAGREEPLLLVAEAGRGSGCRQDWVGYWSRTVAYDLSLRQVWARDTCSAGHHVWPVDEDADGKAEAIFVGKYLLRPDGGLACELAGWPAGDHVDGMAVADLDRDLPGLEAVAVGASGTALFDASTCRQIWRIGGGVIRNPQHVAAARLDPDSAPVIAVEERGTVPGARTFLLDGRGRVLAVTRDHFMPIQNANLDGALGVDELVGSFGEVMDRHAGLRLDRSWYWNLRGGRGEDRSGPFPKNYDRWQAYPLVYDHDGDGRDEIVQWGQSLIVVGKAQR